MNKKRLSKDLIQNMLRTDFIGKNIYFFEQTTSTFDEAEKTDVTNGDVFCARVQTSGRGRLGRQWESEPGGVYFSVVLKPDYKPEDVYIVTSLCAVAVQRTIAKHVPCKIKWPNDIVSENGKKLCGILTKILYKEKNDYYINVGIGINVNTDGFDKDLVHASSIKNICGSTIDENAVLCDCLFEIENCLAKDKVNETMNEYRKNCITLGNRVRLLYANGENKTGLCTDILNDGRLVVEKDDGETEIVFSGEVSVRGIYGENYV